MAGDLHRATELAARTHWPSSSKIQPIRCHTGTAVSPPHSVRSVYSSGPGRSVVVSLLLISSPSRPVRRAWLTSSAPRRPWPRGSRATAWVAPVSSRVVRRVHCSTSTAGGAARTSTGTATTPSTAERRREHRRRGAGSLGATSSLFSAGQFSRGRSSWGPICRSVSGGSPSTLGPRRLGCGRGALPRAVDPVEHNQGCPERGSAPDGCRTLRLA